MKWSKAVHVAATIAAHVAADRDKTIEEAGLEAVGFLANHLPGGVTEGALVEGATDIARAVRALMDHGASR